MQDAGSLYDLLDRGGVLALLSALIVVIIVGGMRGWYYFRWYVSELHAQIAELKAGNRRLEEDVEGWRDLALQQSGTVRQAVRQAVRQPRRPQAEGGQG